MPEHLGTTSTTIGRVPGFLRVGTIIDYDPELLKVQVYIGSIREYGAIKSDYNNIISTQLPINYFSGASEGFAGGYPQNGTPVLVGQGDGGQWFIVQTLAKDVGALNTRIPPVPQLEPGEYRLQVDGHTFIHLNKKDGIIIGEHLNSLNLDTKRDVFSNTFNNIYNFTEASRLVEGVIKRDTFPNENYASSLRETSLDFNDTIKTIGLDPIVKENWSNTASSIRNPARVEKREVIYEFARSFNTLSDDQEFLSYKDNKNIVIKDIINRRESRADALSLSLISPNYLMETIKGSVVDIYGNLLDINRSIIPIGKIDKLSIKNVKTNLEEKDPLGNVFENIKTLTRREIAFHFEINTKKPKIGAPNVNDRSDYARKRSRFYLDIDKEGLLKLNVPASSETGNIPLLTRYENFSTVSPNDKTKNPNDLVFNQNSQDILIESFIGDNAVVQIIDELNSNAAPRDRFSSEQNPVYIKHGTVYHNIAKTCNTFQDNSIVFERVKTTNLSYGRVTNKINIVSPTVRISGDKANGGGRSMSVNLDGSLELNIGANSVDRHSMWLDCQGAIIGNVGRDKRNNISAAFSFDGEVLIQSGGSTPNNDTRFIDVNLNNGHRPGAVDIRVINQSGKVQVVRIDNEGISIHSESRIMVYSNGDVMFRSAGTMHVDAERLILQGRTVRREIGLGSI